MLPSSVIFQLLDPLPFIHINVMYVLCTYISQPPAAINIGAIIFPTFETVKRAFKKFFTQSMVSFSRASIFNESVCSIRLRLFFFKVDIPIAWNFIPTLRGHFHTIRYDTMR